MTDASPGRPRSGAVVATVLARRRPEGRYGVLLVVLIASYVLTAFNRGPLVTDLQIVFFLAVLLLALHASRLSRGRTRVAIAVSLAGSAAAFGVALTGTDTALGAAQLWKGLMLLVTVILIVRRILANPGDGGANRPGIPGHAGGPAGLRVPGTRRATRRVITARCAAHAGV